MTLDLDYQAETDPLILGWTEDDTNLLENYARATRHPESKLRRDPKLWEAFEKDRERYGRDYGPDLLGPCRSCKKMRRKRGRKAVDFPGTVRYGSVELCESCLRSNQTDPALKPVPRIWPRPCLECATPMRPAAALAEEYPNTVAHKGCDTCVSCYRREKRNRARQECA